MKPSKAYSLMAFLWQVEKTIVNFKFASGDFFVDLITYSLLFLSFDVSRQSTRFLL